MHVCIIYPLGGGVPYMRNSMRNRSVWLQTDEAREHVVCTLSTHISLKSAWAQLSSDVSCVYRGRHTLDRRLWEVHHMSSKFCLGAQLVNSIFSALYQIHTLNEIMHISIGSCIYFEKNDWWILHIFYCGLDWICEKLTAVTWVAGFQIRTALQCRFILTVNRIHQRIEFDF